MLFWLALWACTDGLVETGGLDSDVEAIAAPVAGAWDEQPKGVVCDSDTVVRGAVEQAVERWAEEGGDAYLMTVGWGEFGGANLCVGPTTPGTITVRAGEPDVLLTMGPFMDSPIEAADIHITRETGYREFLHMLGHAYGWGDADEEDAPESIMVHDGSGEDFAGGLDPALVLP